MSEHPIEGMMDTTLEKIRQMVDVNTVVGDPITAPDGTVILPVSKISYGFASGGSDFPSKQQTDKSFFGGGAGAGGTVTPLAFLAISNGNVHLLQIDPYNSSADRVIGMIPEVADKINDFLGARKSGRAEKKEAKENGGDVTLDDPQV